jgi:hypothetical protein
MSSFSASTLVNSLSSLSLSSTPSLESVSSNTPSLLEYEFFKCHTILPSIVNSCIRKRLGTPRIFITFAPDHRSGEDLSSFFEDTKYTKKKIHCRQLLLLLIPAVLLMNLLPIFKGTSVPNVQTISSGSLGSLKRVRK